MNTQTTDREDIYDATRDLTCRLAYLVEHLAQKALRGKDIRPHLEVLVHSREALEVAPLFLTLPDGMIDQIETLVFQCEKLQSFIEANVEGLPSSVHAAELRQILLDVPRHIVELPVELRQPAESRQRGRDADGTVRMSALA